jgi:hypothetical protein
VKGFDRQPLLFEFRPLSQGQTAIPRTQRECTEIACSIANVRIMQFIRRNLVQKTESTARSKLPAAIAIALLSCIFNRDRPQYYVEIWILQLDGKVLGRRVLNCFRALACYLAKSEQCNEHHSHSHSHKQKYDAQNNCRFVACPSLQPSAKNRWKHLVPRSPAMLNRHQ